MIDDKEFNSVSQNAHLLGGIVGIWAPFLIWGRLGALWAIPIVLVCAGIKEFWYDNKYETTEVRGSNFEDFFFYFVGVIIAIATLKLTDHI